MGTIYSFQLGALAGTSWGVDVPVSFFVAELPYAWVLRDISGSFIFGSSGDQFEIGLLLGGSGQPLPLIRWDTSGPTEKTLGCRVVMDPGDELYWMFDGSDGAALGGFVASGYRLTPP